METQGTIPDDYHINEKTRYNKIMDGRVSERVDLKTTPLRSKKREGH